MAYCVVEDLLIGDIPTSGALDPQKYVDDAADEIDSHIGFRYNTPIPTEAPTPRPVILLLKRINSHLASGRLVLAAAISAEDEQLNAYGRDLVEKAMLAVSAIASGEQRLIGVVPPTDIDSSGIVEADPILHGNKDAESQVDAFYDKIVMPGTFTLPSQFSHPYSGG